MLLRILLLLLVSSSAWAVPNQAQRDAVYLQTLADIVASDSAISESRMLRKIPRSKNKRQPASVQLAQLLEAHWAWQIQTYPEWATFTGYPGQDARWSDQRVRAAKTAQAMQRETLAVARSINQAELNEQERLNLQLFSYELAMDVEGFEYPEELILVTPMYGVHTSMARALANMPLFTAEQVENYLARLEGIPQLLQQATETLRQGLKAGVTPPQVSLKKVPAQAYGLITTNAADSPLLLPLKNISTDVAQAEDFRRRASGIYEQRLKDAVLGFAKFLEDEYLLGAVQETGLSQLPNGEAWYAWRARKMTTTPLTPQQIHDIGLSEVARITQEMYAIMDEVGFNNHDIPAFAQHLSKDKSQFYSHAEDMLRDYRALAKQADAAVVKLFAHYPSLPYAVEMIPPHEAAGRSAAYYMRGSSKNGRPGTFYFNGSRLAESPKYEMEALLLHEAVPGHHFQLALTQELGELPDFRRHGGFTAYIEGWGLYSERLGHEMGFFQTPQSRFGALTYEMWRAIRLVVDTGMHALGWSRQQAIDYFRDNTGRGLDRISAEVDRYLVMPGQALAYKMGELRIKASRQRAQQALGDTFDLRRFHDHLLSAGALPLTLMEQRVDNWIAAQKVAEQ